MEDTSTTAGNNPTEGDIVADDTTAQDSTTATDTQPATNGDNLAPSKSTEDTADGDTKPTVSTTEEDSASTQLDSDLDDWIEKRGLAKPETDEQKQSYQELRDQQREYTRDRQARTEADNAKKLSEEMSNLKPESSDEDDEYEDDTAKAVRALEEKYSASENTRLQSEFYITNKVTDEQNQAIMDIFKEKVTRPSSPEAKQTAFDLWSSPDALVDLLDLAKARLANNSDTSGVADEAARKERERIAKESQATSPGRGARTTETGNKTPEQERLERFKNWD